MSRRRSGPPRCLACKARIVFFRSPITGSWRPFAPTRVDGRTHLGARAYPVENHRAWRLEDLVEELMARSHQSRDEATDEAYAFPWYVPHDCRIHGTPTPNPATAESEEQ